MHAVLFQGRRYDTGDRASYLRTAVQLACDRPDLGPDFRSWLRRFVDTLPGAELPDGRVGVPAEAAASH